MMLALRDEVEAYGTLRQFKPAMRELPSVGEEQQASFWPLPHWEAATLGALPPGAARATVAAARTTMILENIFAWLGLVVLKRKWLF